MFLNEACKVKSSISFLQLSALCIKDFWRCLEVANDVPMVARATNSLVHNGWFEFWSLLLYLFFFFKILLLWPNLSEAMDALAGVIVHLCWSSITVQTCADSLPLSSIFSYLKLLKSSALFNSEHGTGWQTAFDTTSVSCEDCPYQPKCPPTCSSLRLSQTCMCKLSMLGHACL